MDDHASSSTALSLELTSDGHICGLSASLMRLLGYPRNKQYLLMGRSMLERSYTLIHPDDLTRFTTAFHEAAQTLHDPITTAAPSSEQPSPLFSGSLIASPPTTPLGGSSLEGSVTLGRVLEDHALTPPKLAKHTSGIAPRDGISGLSKGGVANLVVDVSDRAGGGSASGGVSLFSPIRRQNTPPSGIAGASPMKRRFSSDSDLAASPGQNSPLAERLMMLRRASRDDASSNLSRASREDRVSHDSNATEDNDGEGGGGSLHGGSAVSNKQLQQPSPSSIELTVRFVRNPDLPPTPPSRPATPLDPPPSVGFVAPTTAAIAAGSSISSSKKASPSFSNARSNGRREARPRPPQSQHSAQWPRRPRPMEGGRLFGRLVDQLPSTRVSQGGGNSSKSTFLLTLVDVTQAEESKALVRRRYEWSYNAKLPDETVTLSSRMRWSSTRRGTAAVDRIRVNDQIEKYLDRSGYSARRSLISTTGFSSSM